MPGKIASASHVLRYMQEAAASREEDVRAAMVDALERVDDHSPSDFRVFRYADLSAQNQCGTEGKGLPYSLIKQLLRGHKRRIRNRKTAVCVDA